jgi:hypothetical protein
MNRVPAHGIVAAACFIMLVAVDGSKADPEPLTPEPVWVYESDQVNSNLGLGVSTAGDVDGDGYDDVIISSESYPNPDSYGGRAWVFRGSPDGLSTEADWILTPMHQWTSGLGDSSSTAGDVNGDGYDDVIVGVIGHYPEASAYIYHGSVTGLSIIPDAVITSGCGANMFGDFVANAGDINGDGFDDVIVGANHSCRDPGGAAFVYYGSPTGVPTLPDWVVEAETVVGDVGRGVGPAGDVNGDGYDDIIVGDMHFDNGVKGDGGAFVFYGSPNGLKDCGGNCTRLDADWTFVGENRGFLGFRVFTAGDLNGDGFSEVVVGEPGYWDGIYAGGAYVFYGSETGLKDCGGFCLPGDADWTFRCHQGEAEVGRAVATAGDVNTDGYDDLIVAAPFYQDDEEWEGWVFVFLGSGSGLVECAGNCMPWDADWSVESNNEYAFFGHSVRTAGDVNGDGADDIVIGAPDYTVEIDEEGAAFVYHGQPSCITDPSTQGYWHRQCLGVPVSEGGIDPGRNGRGPESPTEPGFVEELMPCADDALEDSDFYGIMTCDGMDADPASDPCERALKQYTTLLLNRCSGRVADGCTVDVNAQGCTSSTIGGLISEVADLIHMGNCQQASDCAGAVNEGTGFSEDDSEVELNQISTDGGIKSEDDTNSGNAPGRDTFRGKFGKRHEQQARPNDQ